MKCERAYSEPVPIKPRQVITVKGYSSTWQRHVFGPRAVRLRRCGRKAQVLARIPFGTGFIESRLCAECAERRAADVLASRGATVQILPLER